MSEPTLELSWAAQVANGSATPTSGVFRDGGQTICAGSGQIELQEDSVSFVLESLSISSNGSCPGLDPVPGSLAGCVDIAQDF
jgi:hypothetical protein